MTAEKTQDLSLLHLLFDCVSIRIKTLCQSSSQKSFKNSSCLFGCLVGCVASRRLAKRQFILFYVFWGEVVLNNLPNELVKIFYTPINFIIM